jgi:micrococcal nuclease
MYHYKVKSIDKVIDGDTVDVTIDLGFNLLQQVRVRLTGIDAPENRTLDLEEKAKGIMSREFLKDALENAKYLTLETTKTGKYGRYLGDFYDRWGLNEEQHINQLMIKEGHAAEYIYSRKIVSSLPKVYK